MSEDFDYIVVAGASAGGVESLMELVRSLPDDFAAPLLIVQHIPAHPPSRLAQILSRQGRLPVTTATDGLPLRAGQVYVAPSDEHLLVERGHIRVTRGPRENRFRPSVDVLFRSAAQAYGPAVAALVLSGTLDDGSAGLWAVQRRGGVVAVQDPADALFADMPRNALDWVPTAAVLPLAQIGPWLSELVRGPVTGRDGMNEEERRQLEIEVLVAQGEIAMSEIMTLGQPSHFSCPDCQGNLLEVRESGGSRYRCHVGHAFSSATLLASLTDSTGEHLTRAIRSLEETSILLHELGDQYSRNGQNTRAELFLDHAHEAERRSRDLQELRGRLAL